MLTFACEEVIIEGDEPLEDAAVALIAGRIAFASPTDTMSEAAWDRLVQACKQGSAGKIHLAKTPQTCQ